MASEYMKWKAQQEIAAETPAQPQRELTRREKVQNWLHYHWLYLVIGAILVWIVGSMLWNVLGIGKIKPDYIVAYVGANALSEDCEQAVEAAFSELGVDVTGDGRVAVELRQYPTNRSGDLETALYYNYANDTVLMADITAGENYFFLTDDPAGLQRAYQILANPDGTPPSEDDFSAENKVFSLESCPALRALCSTYPELSGLFLGRRCFYGEEAENQTESAALWQALTEGASP